MCLWSAGDFEAVYRFATIGQQILDYFGDRGKAVQPRTNVIILCICYPWKKPLPSLVASEVRAFDEALQLDVEWAVSGSRGFSMQAIMMLALSHSDLPVCTCFSRRDTPVFI